MAEGGGVIENHYNTPRGRLAKIVLRIDIGSGVLYIGGMKKQFFLRSIPVLFCFVATNHFDLKARAEEQQTGEPSVTSVDAEALNELESMHAKGQTLIAAGQLREALQVYWDIILLEPDDEAAYTNLGNLYLILGDTDQAKDAFQNALHINPENEYALMGLQKIIHPDGNLTAGEDR